MAIEMRADHSRIVDPSRQGRRIVLATFGSLGDLHPFIALAKGLKARGYEPAIATSGLHRERVEGQGVGFHSVGPDFSAMEHDAETHRRAMDLKHGGEYVFKQLLMPHLRSSYDDLRAALEGADLLVAHLIMYAAPLVVEATHTPWLTVALSPISFFSKYDPPVPPPAAWMRHLHRLGPRFWGPFNRLAKWTVRSWTEPVRRFRAELGLPSGGDPIFDDAFSPHGTLALFSPLLGEPQDDWPAKTTQTGFAFFDDGVRDESRDCELERFLGAGDPPIVFTLGSSAVMDAGRFYDESLAAARKLGRRAVLLIGRDPRNQPSTPLPDEAIAIAYAPYAELFPRAAAIVHQGGVGTTGQGLRSGRPTLVVPWSHDQPDNAHRVSRLGVGKTVTRARYTGRTAAALRRLIDDPAYAARAEDVGRRVRAEDGVGAACDVIEQTLEASRRRT